MVHALKLASLTNLTELCILIEKMSFDYADTLSKSLINLEVLRMHDGSLENAIPFVRQLPKLRHVEAEKKTSDAKFCISSLNNDRKKLREAVKLIIYLGPEAFLEVRWESTQLQYEMVEIRRWLKQCDRCWARW